MMSDPKDFQRGHPLNITAGTPRLLKRRGHQRAKDVMQQMKTIITILLLLASTGAMAQQQTIYGPDGRVTGRITTDSQGSKRSTTPAVG